MVPDPMAQVLGASKHSSEGAAPGGGRSSDLGKWMERNGGADPVRQPGCSVLPVITLESGPSLLAHVAMLVLL